MRANLTKVMTVLTSAILLLSLSGPVCGAFIDRINAIPDYTQTDPAYGGLPGGGGAYCGPVSTSNSVMWLADNGFANLAPHSADAKKDQFDVAELLGSPTYMDTFANNGTSANGICNGIKEYILDKGYQYSRLEYQGWRPVDAQFDTGVDVPDLGWTRDAIEARGGALLNVGWYTYNAVQDKYTRFGGHWVTMVGHGHDGTDDDPDYLIAHDPAPRAGMTFANEYVLPVLIPSGTLDGSYTGLPTAAAGYYKLTDGMHLNSSADFGIFDGIIVLEMAERRFYPGRVLMYRETFPNSASTGDLTNNILFNGTSQQGWSVHYGTGTPSQDVQIADRIGDGGPAAVNSSPGHEGLEGNGYLYSSHSPRTDFIMWTDEHRIDDVNTVASLQWSMRNETPLMQFHAVVRLDALGTPGDTADDPWFASDESFDSLDGIVANNSLRDAWRTDVTFDFHNARWRNLSFKVDSELALRGTFGSLPEHVPVTAFGLYTPDTLDSGNGMGFEFRIDNFAVLVVPEPATVCLLILGVVCLLPCARRRHCP